MNHELRITYGTSRGAETYGYGLVNLYERGVKKASCSGGGYDMRGTVFADWLEAEYQDRLMALAVKKPGTFDRTIWNGKMEDGKAKELHKAMDRKTGLYGGKYYTKGNRVGVYDKAGDFKKWTSKPPRVELDGGCGLESIRRIAVVIGLNVRQIEGGKKLDIILIEDTKPARD